jgi:hypothetical protein
MMKRVGVLGAALAILVAASIASAQTVDEGTRAAARSLGNAGVEAYQAGNFELAATKLDKAYQILRVPSLGLWSARAFAKVGKLLQASERYREVTRLEPSAGDVAVQRQAQAEAASELEAIQPRIPSVVVRVEGATTSEVSVTLDGVPLSSALIGEARPVNPGTHEVTGQRGNETATTRVSVKEGEQGSAVLRFDAPSAPTATPVASTTPSSGVGAPTDRDGDGSTTRTLGFIALGAGGVGLVVGAVTGSMALGKRADIDDNPNCEADACAPSEQDEVDGLNSLRTVSTVAFIAGGVLAGTGLVLVFTSGSSREPAASAYIGPTGAGLRGRF